MFKVIVTKADNSKICQCFAQPHSVDFVHVLPRQLSFIAGEVITKDDIEIYKFPEADTLAIHTKITETVGNKLELEGGSVGSIQVLDSSDDLLQEWIGALMTWPYDEDGNFTGNN